MKPPGKRRTRQHVIADLSINFVERQALLCGYIVQRMQSDYGIDLEIQTFDHNGEQEPGAILLQVKATDGLLIDSKQVDFPWRVERADLIHWRAELMPVILVVYDARRTKACWLCIQEYFESLRRFNLFEAGRTITVRIPVANRFNARGVRELAKLRDEFRKRIRRPNHD